MAKKKVMKTVSVPTLKEVEVTTCDICGKDVGDYRWWMSMEIDDGCMGEFYLDIDVWEDGDKIRCINDSEQNTLKLNEIYTVDTSMNTTDNRVYVKENKRFSFMKSRFELVEDGL